LCFTHGKGGSGSDAERVPSSKRRFIFVLPQDHLRPRSLGKEGEHPEQDEREEPESVLSHFGFSILPVFCFICNKEIGMV
jgi:hypothetical protein